MTRRTGNDLAEWNKRVWLDGDRRAPIGAGERHGHVPGSLQRHGTPTRFERGALFPADRCTDPI